MRYKIGLAFTLLGLLACTFAKIAAAAVVISPPTVDFGVQPGSIFGNGSIPPDWIPTPGLVFGGTTDVRTVALTNTGPGALTIVAVEASAVSLGPVCDPGSTFCLFEPPSFECAGVEIFYSATAFPVVLQPGESCQFSVFYIIEGLGPLSAALRISTDASTSPHVVPISALRRTYIFIADTVTTGQAAEVDIDFTGCAMTAADWLPRPGAAGSVSTQGLFAGAVLPYGVLRFEAQPCAASATRTLSILFPGAVPPGAKYLAFGPTPTDGVAHWFEIPAVVSGKSITFQVADNGPGDADSATGIILSHTALGSLPAPSWCPRSDCPC